MTDFHDRGWPSSAPASSDAASPAGRGAAPMEERAAAPASDDSSVPSTSGASQRDDGFIQHKVSKTDTLAGLAVRYGIHVSDIKRANGLLSDSAMFAREFILIPTKQLPMSEDAQVLFAKLLCGYGRDASLNAKERRAPGTSAAVQLPGSPIAGSRCGSEAEDDTGTPYSRRSDRSASEPGDVELMERSAAGEFLANGGAGGFGSDKVRRRNRASGTDAAAALHSAGAAALAAAGALGTMAGGAAGAAMEWLAAPAAAPPPRGPALPSPGRGAPGAPGAVVEQTWHQLSGAANSLVEKIKRAASQPALGPSTGHSGYGDAADLLLAQQARAAAAAGGGAGRPPGGGGATAPALGHGLGGSAGDLRRAAAAAAAAAAPKKPGCAKND
ncbi:MAG: hypothetical protein J3K34DRAFT_520248 [Monoraphidium minutum]|nr:MAG: hypothetical protein J3K34DRAFT_520248 [Monoraphidium minutum]